MRKNPVLKTLVVLIFSLLVAYVFTSFIRTIIDGENNMQYNFLDYQGTITYLFNTSAENQFIVAVLSGFFFVLMLKEFFKKKDSFDDASDYGVHGTARFAKFEEVINGKLLSKKNKYKKKEPTVAIKRLERGIILGKIPDKDELLIIPEDTELDNRNVFVVGSSGSGKGQSVVNTNLVNNDRETIIVIDPKNELYRDTADIKRDQGYEVYRIDFVNYEHGGYNPLDYVKDDQEAMKVANTIAKNSGKNLKEDFFHNEGKDLITGLFIYCVTEYKSANIPKHVMDLFHEISDRDKLLELVDDNMDKDHPAYRLLKGASVHQGKTWTSILGTAKSQLSVFTIGKVAKTTETSSFNFHDLQEKKSIVYVNIPMEDNSFPQITATFFDQLISEFYTIAYNNNSFLKIPTILLFDEFANIGKIEKYPKVLSTCRGLGMSIFTIVQDIAQIEQDYGDKVSRTIINNHDSKIFLRTGDKETAKYFSGLAGDTTAKVKQKGTSSSGGIFTTKSSTSRSNNWSYVKRALIDEGKLLNIKRDDSYVFISGQYPLKTEKAWQFNIYGDMLSNYKEKYRNHLLKVYKKDNISLSGHKTESISVNNNNTTSGTLGDNEYQIDDEMGDTTGNQYSNIDKKPSDVNDEIKDDNNEIEQDINELLTMPHYESNSEKQSEIVDDMAREVFITQNIDSVVDMFERETEEYVEKDVNSTEEDVSVDDVLNDNSFYENFTDTQSEMAEKMAQEIFITENIESIVNMFDTETDDSEESEDVDNLEIDKELFPM